MSSDVLRMKKEWQSFNTANSPELSHPDSTELHMVNIFRCLHTQMKLCELVCMFQMYWSIYPRLDSPPTTEEGNFFICITPFDLMLWHLLCVCMHERNTEPCASVHLSLYASWGSDTPTLHGVMKKMNSDEEFYSELPRVNPVMLMGLKYCIAIFAYVNYWKDLVELNCLL